jgi:hypothetical protein
MPLLQFFNAICLVVATIVATRQMNLFSAANRDAHFQAT